MKLVYEDEHGAYLGVTPEFLRGFKTIESNPHFEVFDSFDGRRRFIAVNVREFLTMKMQLKVDSG